MLATRPEPCYADDVDDTGRHPWRALFPGAFGVWLLTNAVYIADLAIRNQPSPLVKYRIFEGPAFTSRDQGLFVAGTYFVAGVVVVCFALGYLRRKPPSSD